MKFELSTIENDLEFNKKLKPIKQQEWKDLYFHSFKNFVLFITGVSSASIFLFLNKVSFQQQIDFVTQSNFNCSLMFLFGIYCFFLIITDIIYMSYNPKKILDNKFSSIWMPIKMSLSTFFIMPINHEGDSFFSHSIVQIIHVIQQFF